MKNILIIIILFITNNIYSQDTLIFKGTLSNIDIASMTLIAYNTQTIDKNKTWKVYHQKIINTERDSTFSFHIEHDPNYMYVILIEDFKQLINGTSNRIIYNMKQCFRVELDIVYKSIENCIIDYVILEDYKKGDYKIVERKNYN